MTEDETAIRALAAAYTDAVNRHDPVAGAAVYAPDGVLIAYDTPPIAGRAAIETLFVARWPQAGILFQCLHSGLVEIDGDRAHARWWLSEYNCPVNETAGRMNLFAYQDELVRLPERWRFARRNLQTCYRERRDYPAKRQPPLAMDHRFGLDGLTRGANA
ncbi:MAG: nuclear transport factor 2 family protein [Sphingomonadaceae bacterium]|nr:nuclear transport factor 2 family protein [Sphingomonadaceae bacterium]